MPEYLAPGVYVEEVSFRSKSIEGVPTSTTGFAGMTRYGPVQHPNGPKTTEPRLITSFTEFERVYGGLQALEVGPTGADEQICFLAHAARAFFDNGGKRLYVSRVFVPRGPTVADQGVASATVAIPGPPAASAIWNARWPGLSGNVLVDTKVVRSGNIAFRFEAPDPRATWGPQAKRAKAGAVVEIFAAATPLPLPAGNDPVALADLAVVEVAPDGRQTFVGSAGNVVVNDGDFIRLIEMQVVVVPEGDSPMVYDELAADPRQKRYLGKILQLHDPEDENAQVWMSWAPPTALTVSAARLITALRGSDPNGNAIRLQGGHDGLPAQPDDLAGAEADPDDALKKATGLAALGEIDDIAIVCLPDGGGYDDPVTAGQAADRVISHAERLRYRIAVVDAPRASSMTEIRAFRGRFDSKYAALYHPWIEIFDPTERPSQGAPPRRLLLPPSGFVTGIYARSDIERGVHKAPANEVVRGLTRFEANINKARQDVLNPEGINALRFFDGRGNRVWGARTMSSDPEWKYVNVRRLFIYIEHSIDKGTQWAVFEPNGPRLWANIRQTVEDFLLVLWRDGALLGDKPEQAYFVRCDRTTMTQNDLDNGRMICLVGVAPVKPAEFVIFRIGQWTGDAKV
ncbi:MAG TPA: phage tail sheath subtilisin-like domain-containing protein [Pyrinomonadaceae bacterium]|jgi:phage tail sheath protein FI|nr:phage tail sheath subtilisin-like domain-containing protein [Pyrinomonadaceae bacterium]